MLTYADVCRRWCGESVGSFDELAEEVEEVASQEEEDGEEQAERGVSWHSAQLEKRMRANIGQRRGGRRGGVAWEVDVGGLGLGGGGGVSLSGGGVSRSEGGGGGGCIHRKSMDSTAATYNSRAQVLSLLTLLAQNCLLC